MDACNTSRYRARSLPFVNGFLSFCMIELTAESTIAGGVFSRPGEKTFVCVTTEVVLYNSAAIFVWNTNQDVTNSNITLSAGISRRQVRTSRSESHQKSKPDVVEADLHLTSKSIS